MAERDEKFTPGEYTHRKGNTTVLDCNGNPIAMFYQARYYRTKEEAVANVNLFEAAPKMYAELKDLLDAMESGLFPQAAPGVDYPAVMEKKWELRKLLKKARGEE